MDRRSVLLGGATVAGLAGAWRYFAHHRSAHSPEGASTKGVVTPMTAESIEPAGPALGHWNIAGASPPRNDGPGFGPGAGLLSAHEPPTG